MCLTVRVIHKILCYSANVLLVFMSVRFTVVIAEISKFCILSVCDFKLSYPACNEYGPYWHSLCARYIDFTKLSHRGIIFEIKLLTEICVLILSENFVQIISHCKKKERSTIKIYVSLLLIDCSVTVTIVKFECIANCQKYSNTNFMKTGPVGTDLLLSCRHTQTWRM